MSKIFKNQDFIQQHHIMTMTNPYTFISPYFVISVESFVAFHFMCIHYENIYIA